MVHSGTISLRKCGLDFIEVMKEELGVPGEVDPALTSRMSSAGTCCWTQQGVQRDWVSLTAPGDCDRLQR